MKKFTSALLLTIGSLGILAGIAGAVYAFSRNGSKIRDWITGDTSSSSKSEDEKPSGNGGQSSSRPDDKPTEVPYDDPSKPLGVTVAIEPFEFSHENATSEIQVPITVRTTGWSEENENLSLSYELVGFSGQAVPEISLKKDGTDIELTGSSGSLPGGGKYTLSMTRAGYDEFYVYQFKATVSDGDQSHVGQAKFVSNGAVSLNPYQGNDPSSGITLASMDGGTDMATIQTEDETANTASYYVASTYANSTKLVKVTAVPFEEGDTLTMTTEEFGTSGTELTVPVGTEIRFTFPLKEQGECDRYRMKLSFVGEEETWVKTIKNYGRTLSANVLDHPEGNLYYDPEIDGCVFTIRPRVKAEDDDGLNTITRVEVDSSLKGIPMTVEQNGGDRDHVDLNNVYGWVQISRTMSDQEIKITLGHLDPGASGQVTFSCFRMKWVTNYSRTAETPTAWWDPTTVIMKDGKSVTKTYKTYWPENMQDNTKSTVCVRNIETKGSSVGNVLLSNASSDAEQVASYNGGQISIVIPAMGEGEYKLYDIEFYYDGQLVGVQHCNAGRRLSNCNRETICNVHGQSVSQAAGKLCLDFGIYFENASAGKTAWLEIRCEELAGLTFGLTSNHFAAYNGTGNLFQDTVTPPIGKMGHVKAVSAQDVPAGTYTVRVKHFYTADPAYENAYCTFNKAITFVVA